MNKIKRSLATLILAVMTGLFIAAISCVNYSQQKKATQTDAIATVTDAVATLTDIPVTLATSTDVKVEKVKITKARVILDNRQLNMVDVENKTSFNTNNVYIIEQHDEAYYVINFNTNEILWYASPIKEDFCYSTKNSCLRQTPNVDSRDFILLKEGYRVQRVAVSENGWDIVKYGDYLYFTWYENLGYEPLTEAPTTTEEEIVYIEPVAETPVQDPNPQTEAPSTEAPAYSTDAYYTPEQLMYSGVIYWGGYAWTWYSENVLPGEGLDIPGRYTDGSGFVCDGDGYICLASSDLPKGTVVDTLFGRPGKVYDCGCASGVLDVYVGW